MDRRAFTKNVLSTVTSYALLDALFAYNAFSNSVKPIVKHWAMSLNEYCFRFEKSKASLHWSGKIE